MAEGITWRFAVPGAGGRPGSWRTVMPAATRGPMDGPDVPLAVISPAPARPGADPGSHQAHVLGRRTVFSAMRRDRPASRSFYRPNRYRGPNGPPGQMVAGRRYRVPSPRARRSCRVRAPVLARMALRWSLAVCSDTTIRSAISRVSRPSQSSARTSDSRRVNPQARA